MQHRLRFIGAKAVHSNSQLCLFFQYFGLDNGSTLVDDMLIELAPLLRRPGPTPPCSDSELITMILVAECKGWDIETQLLSASTPICSLYCLSSRFNRLTQLGGNQIRFDRCSDIEAASENLCIIDSLPMPVKFHIVPSSSNDWSCYGADYGRVESNKQIFGYKLHLLVTASGVIVDFELALLKL